MFVDKELQRVDRAAMQDLDAKDVKLQFPCFKPMGNTVLVMKSPKTHSSIRRVYIPTTVAKLLLTLKQEQDELKELLGDEYKPYNLVICSPDGRPIEGQIINRAFNKLIKDHNLPKVVFHQYSETVITLRKQYQSLKGRAKQEFSNKHSKQLDRAETLNKYWSDYVSTGKKILPKQWARDISKLKNDIALCEWKMKALKDEIGTAEKIKKILSEQQIENTEQQRTLKRDVII